MAQSKAGQNNLRNMLLSDGTIKQTVDAVTGNNVRHIDRTASQAAAIAARRADLGIKPLILSGGMKRDTYNY